MEKNIKARGSVSAIVVVMLAVSGSAMETVELLDAYQSDSEKSILTYTYRTSDLDSKRAYKLRTSIRAKAGEPSKRTEKTVVLTNDITSANGTTTKTVDLTTVLGPDAYPDCEVLLSIIGIDPADTIPPGTIYDFAGKTLPDGFLLCNGKEVSRTTYLRLFAAIGTKYGAGDGKTTFKLPNFSNAFAEGASKTDKVGSGKAPGIPDIRGYRKTEVAYPGAGGGKVHEEGAFHDTKLVRSRAWVGQSGNEVVDLKFLASKGELHNGAYRNDVYGKSDTVQPKSVVVLKIIKY